MIVKDLEGGKQEVRMGSIRLFKITWAAVGNALPISILSVRRESAKIFGRGAPNLIYVGAPHLQLPCGEGIGRGTHVGHVLKSRVGKVTNRVFKVMKQDKKTF